MLPLLPSVGPSLSSITSSLRKHPVNSFHISSTIIESDIFLKHKLKWSEFMHVTPEFIDNFELPSPLSPPSGTLREFCWRQMTTIWRRCEISDGCGRSGIGWHGCWIESDQMPGSWGWSTLQWYRQSCYIGRSRGLCPPVLIGPLVDSNTGSPADWLCRNRGEYWMWLGCTPSGGGYCGFRSAGGGDIHFLPPEHSCTVHFDRAHYEPLSGGGATPGDKVV